MVDAQRDLSSVVCQGGGSLRAREHQGDLHAAFVMWQSQRTCESEELAWNVWRYMAMGVDQVMWSELWKLPCDSMHITYVHI